MVKSRGNLTKNLFVPLSIAELRPGKAKNPAEISDGNGDPPGENGSPKDSIAGPLAGSSSAEGAGDADTELLELRMPDEASTFERILAGFQKPTQENGVSEHGASGHPGDARSVEEIVRDTLQQVGNNGLVYVGRLGHVINDIDYAQHARKTVSWSLDHPLDLGMGIAAAFPVILVAPAFGVLGFGAGIIKGSIAATLQSAIGNVAAGSGFAVLQSAAAGGPGLQIVHGVVRTAFGLGLGTSAVVKVKELISKAPVAADASNLRIKGGMEQSLDE
ncbi:MAG: hypothetical protein Q9169_008269, partial [Polycauliona sp. 2 TL-2023]